MSRKKKLTPFGKAVRKKMIDMDLNTRKLAKLIGMDKRYLGAILRGERTGAKYIKAIEDWLGLDHREYTA